MTFANCNLSQVKKKFFIICVLIWISNFSYSQEMNAEQLYKKINDAVVSIYTYDIFDKPISQGSGVVINQIGWIVTNYHVYANSSKIIVKHKNKEVLFDRIIAFDVNKDVLILKIANNIFPSITLGNSDKINIGQKVFAIGSPLGLENSISDGIISGLRANEFSLKKYIQISSPISPGSSGGALINTKGELIGITTLTYTKGQNLNFAIPVNDVIEMFNQKIVQQKSLNAASIIYKAQVEYNNENYNAAFKLLLEAEKITPNDASIYRNLGVIEIKKQNYASSISYIKKAISLDPNNAGNYYNLGLAYYKSNSYANAIGALLKSLKIDPTSANAYYTLGMIYTYGEPISIERAIENFKKTLQFDPNFTDAYYMIAFINSKAGDINVAIEYYKKAINSDHKYEDSYKELGFIYLDNKQFDSAIVFFKKGLEINPANSDVNFGLGSSYNAIQEFNLGITVLKSSIRLYNKLKSTEELSNYYYQLGKGYQGIKDWGNAITALQKSIALNPKSGKLLFLIGYLYGENGDLNNSILYYKKCIEINPENPITYWNLSGIYKRKGDINMQNYYMEKYNSTK